MKDLRRIEAAYYKLDGILEAERPAFSGQLLVRIEAEQSLNDQAYFLLCWGQLEAEINDVCRNAIRVRQAADDWQSRRAWDWYNPDDKRLSGLSFEQRTALVLDRKAGKGSAWAKTMFYYKTRNEIAHGSLSSVRIDIVSFTRDCYLIQAALHRAR